ncbi:MAG: nuclear transport factor 2 family protein [Acidimicrobiales bacterium]
MTEFLDLPFPDADDRSARAASLRSRDAVQRGDKDAWLAIFAHDAVVQDPVGVSPLDESGQGHHGKEAIAAFYDTVIAPNPITMDVRSSHAGGDEVANVIQMTTTLPDGTKVRAELVAIYKVRADGLVESLRAFWEFDQLQFEAPT